MAIVASSVSASGPWFFRTSWKDSCYTYPGCRICKLPRKFNRIKLEKPMILGYTPHSQNLIGSQKQFHNQLLFPYTKSTSSRLKQGGLFRWCHRAFPTSPQKKQLPVRFGCCPSLKNEDLAPFIAFIQGCLGGCEGCNVWKGHQGSPGACSWLSWIKIKRW